MNRLRIPVLLVLATGLVLALAATADAHPHIFFDQGLAIRLGAEAECRVEVTLFPDEMTGLRMFGEGDANRDGTIDEDEHFDFEVDYWEWFEGFEYFVRVFSDGEEIEIREVEDFAIAVDGENRIRVTFAAVADLPARALGPHRLEVDLKDPSYYTAFTQVAERCVVRPSSGEARIEGVSLLEHGRGVKVKYDLVTPEEAAAAPAQEDVTGASSDDLSLKARFYRALQWGMDQLADMLETLSREFRGGLFFTFVGFALLYGVFHALGPGHGKAVVAAFLVRENARPAHAVLLSLFVTLTHTGTSLLLALGVQLAKTSMEGQQFEQSGQAWVGLGSGVLVLAIGVLPALLFVGRRAWRRISPASETAAPSAGGEETVTMARIGRWGVAAGLVPCPASIVIMLISIAAGVFWVGLVAVIALAVGLSGVLLGIGLAVVYSRQGLLRRLEGSPWAGRMEAVAEVGGALLVSMIGILLIGFYLNRLQFLGAI